MGHFQLIRPDPTHQLMDPTRPEPSQIKRVKPDRSRPNAQLRQNRFL